MKKAYTYFYISILILSHFPGLSQINFQAMGALREKERRFLRADSAILAGEFGEIHSLLIIQNAKLISEKYYNGWQADSLHQLQSATKSIVATLYGCALQEKFITGPETKIASCLTKLSFKNELSKSITIEDLLTQRHGLKWKESPWDDPDNNWRNIYTTGGNWYQKILDTDMDTIPGTKFNYSNAAPVLITEIIQETTKIQIDAFAKKYLFDPLQISNYRFWNGNGGPQNNGMALLYLRSKDMAKIGQLYLQQGKWNQKQLIPADFVKQAISDKVKNVNPNGPYSGYDYGYFWWSNPIWRKTGKALSVFLARGAGGQNIIVWPEKQLVVVITAWNMQQPNKPEELFEKYIIEEL